MNLEYRLLPQRILPSVFAAMPWCTNDVALGIHEALADAAEYLDVARGLHRKPVLNVSLDDNGAQEKDVPGAEVHIAGDQVDRLHVDLAAQKQHLAVDVRKGGKAVFREFYVLPDKQLAVLPLGGRYDCAGDGLPGLPASAGILRASIWPATTFSTREISLKSTRPSFSRRVTASRSSLKLYSTLAFAPSCARVPSATMMGRP